MNARILSFWNQLTTMIWMTIEEQSDGNSNGNQNLITLLQQHWTLEHKWYYRHHTETSFVLWFEMGNRCEEILLLRTDTLF